MAATPYTATVKHSDVKGTFDGGAAGVFLVANETGSYDLRTKYTPDPANWPSDDDSVLVTTTTSTASWGIEQLTKQGYTSLRIVNGTAIYQSLDHGQTWPPL